jgi:hypothetical protein
MYRGVNEMPENGQLCLCRCPHWCELGYQVAVFENGIFDYPEAPNSRFHENVIAWNPLDINGKPF